jgi:Ca2+-binding RTX toxin-like protein
MKRPKPFSMTDATTLQPPRRIPPSAQAPPTQEETMNAQARLQDFHFRAQATFKGEVQLPAVQRVEGDAASLIEGPVIGTPLPPPTGSGDFIGGDGNDTWNGTSAAEVAYGNGGDDTLRGAAGNDKLYGGAGKDRLEGGDGNDTLYGGDDNDQLHGNAGDDAMYGDAGTDYMRGGDGNDTMSGGSGYDEMYGDAGNDIMNGGSGDDVMVGGTGNDTMHGNDHNDILYGGDGTDTMYGDNGNDTMLGGAGSDTMYGGYGNDLMFGEAGNDVMSGGDGNDTLIGGAGFEQMTGGAGIDKFVFNAVSDSDSGGIWDLITDFQRGTDKIDLSAIDANALDGGWLNDIFTFVGSVPFSGNATESFGLSPGELRYQQYNGFTYVMGDVTGDGEADITIALQGTYALSASDFIL